MKRTLKTQVMNVTLQQFAANAATDAKAILRKGAEALIPAEVAQEIVSGVSEYSSIMKLATKAPNMSSKQRRLPVLSSLPTAYFVNGDTGMKATSNAEWANKFFEAEELAVIIPIPEAVLEDAEYDIWNEIKPRIMEAFGVAFDEAVLYGTNAPSTWPKNILESAEAAKKVVTAGTGEDLYADILGADGLYSAVESSGYGVTGNIAHMSMKGKYRGLRDKSGQPIFKTSMQSPTAYELDGAYLEFPRNGVMDSKKALQFAGDFKQILYTMRQDVTYKILDQAVIQNTDGSIAYNLAQQDMVALRAVMRLAWQIPNPINRLESDNSKRYPIAVLKPAGL